MLNCYIWIELSSFQLSFLCPHLRTWLEMKNIISFDRIPISRMPKRGNEIYLWDLFNWIETIEKTSSASITWLCVLVFCRYSFPLEVVIWSFGFLPSYEVLIFLVCLCWSDAICDEYPSNVYHITLFLYVIRLSEIEFLIQRLMYVVHMRKHGTAYHLCFVYVYYKLIVFFFSFFLSFRYIKIGATCKSEAKVELIASFTWSVGNS